MNSLFDLCEYGFKIKDVVKLKESRITVNDVINGRIGKHVINKKIYNLARKKYKLHSDVFKKDSIYELYEYGISIVIIDSLRKKTTIKELKEKSDEYLKNFKNIKYATLKKIRNCGYFCGKKKEEVKNENEDRYNQIKELKKYGLSLAYINKIMLYNFEFNDFIFWDLQQIMNNFKFSKTSANKISMILKKYREDKNIKEPTDKKIINLIKKETQYSYMSISEIKENIGDNYSDEEIKKSIEKNLVDGIIVEKNGNYRYKYPKLEECINNIADEKARDMVNLKLHGYSLAKIGDIYNLSRERIRQIIWKHMNNIVAFEDIYMQYIKEYNISKEDFVIAFELSEEVYEYLNYIYCTRKKSIKDFLEDYPEYFDEEKREKIREKIKTNYRRMKSNCKIFYNGSYIKLNHTEILKEYIKKLKNKTKLNDILKDLNSEYERLGINPLGDIGLETRLQEIDNVINGLESTYKYFNYGNISDAKKEFIIKIIRNLPDGYYSTYKLYKDNEDFFNSINIEDECEVQSLLKKISKNKIPDLFFKTMPKLMIYKLRLL